jgi:hypothetical protein
MNEECMQTETSNRKDTGNKKHDRENKAARWVYTLSEKIIKIIRTIQETFPTYNTMAIFLYKAGEEEVGRGQKGTHQESFQEKIA